VDSIVADVYFNGERAGVLEKHAQGFRFTYLKGFLTGRFACPISYSFPLREDPYEAEQLFPFFEGLVSEGWLLKIQSQSQKIDERDFFALLVSNGQDLIGAVSIKPRNES